VDYDYDTIVIGSGFGGSVSAMRLSEKGHRVAVLECGSRYRSADFPKTNWNLRKSVFMPKLGLRGLMRYTLLPHVMILSGAGVGGGSLVYANTLYVPPEAFFQSPRWAHIRDWKETLMPHYREAERMLGVVDSPFAGPGDLALKQCAEDIGRGDTYRPTRVGVFFDQPGVRVPDPYFGGEGPERTGCNLCGGCMVGCRVGAKNTLDQNYLWFAEKRGTRVFPERMAVDVKPMARGGYEVTHERSGAWARKDKSVLRARSVVFSAGVLGTVRLLMACKARGSLPGLSDHLGRRVMTNSESILAVTARDTGIDYSRGIAIATSVFPDEHTHIEVVRYSKGSSLNKVLSAYLTDGGTKLTRPLKFLANLALHPIDFFRALWPYRWAERTSILLVMQTLENSIRLVPKPTRGGVRLSSALEDGSPPIPTFLPAGNDFARRMAAKIGGVPQSTINEVLLNVPMTAHVLGGASVGDSPDTGVIDQYHRVFGHEGLYVCDGSAVPANLGVNPSLTITAMSEHAMSHVPVRSRPTATASA
jgi:cholesterol oxidase